MKLPMERMPQLLLRAGLALMFLYAAISGLTNPNSWVGYLPHLITDHTDAHTVMPFFSMYELVLATWLLSGLYVRYAALLVAVTLAGIVLSNMSLFAITFRDMALMFAALALAAMPEPQVSSDKLQPKP
jgi:uncharacterized membrane protein YphA (DoxX/SURF4 family)